MSEHLTKLSLASLDRLSDGRAGKVIENAIRRCAADLEAVPDDRRPRKIEIDLELNRNPKSGIVYVRVKIRLKIPSTRTNDTICEANGSGASIDLLFNPVSAANPDQLVMFGDEEVEA